MDEQTRLYLWMGVFFIGLVVFFMGVFRKQSPIKINPVLGAVVGICLILPGFIWGIFPTIGSPASPIQTQPNIIVNPPSTTTTPVGPAGWTITPVDQAASGWPNLATTWNAGKTLATAAATINEGGTTHYVFAANSTELNFTIAPIAGAGATNVDVYTLHYSTDYAMTYSGAKLLTYTGTTYWANITLATSATTGTKSGSSYEGSGSFIATSAPMTVHFRYVLSNVADTSGAAYYLSTPGLVTDPWTIRFWDDFGHTYEFQAQIVVIVST